MIVADTNIISYLFLPTTYSEQASQLYKVDADWVAPELWRSEFRNVLALYMRQNILSLTEVMAIQDEAESMMNDREFSLPSIAVMNLIASSTCSAYDCEFVALAKQLSVKLVTQDKKLLREFPQTAISIDDFLTGTFRSGQ